MLIHIPLLDALLQPHAAALGRDLAGYSNHAYRVVNLAWAAGDGDDAAFERLVIAAAFHDLGIWTARTFDYIDPSLALAREHLRHAGRDLWQDEVAAMIANHHRVCACADACGAAAERFRRADWADVTRGWLGQGFDSALLADTRRVFPARGFYCGVARRALWRCVTHPLRPLPMLRW